MPLIGMIAQYIGYVSTIATAAAIVIKPLRNRLFGLKQLRAGIKCQLRSDMLRTYYHNVEKGTIRQYEYENFLASYEAYKALHGNSFMDKVNAEVATWKVIT